MIQFNLTIIFLDIVILFLILRIIYPFSLCNPIINCKQSTFVRRKETQVLNSAHIPKNIKLNSVLSNVGLRKFWIQTKMNDSSIQ